MKELILVLFIYTIYLKKGFYKWLLKSRNVIFRTFRCSRGHLIRSVIAIFIFTVLAFLNKNFLFDHILLASKEPDFITYRLLCRVSEWFNLGDVLCITEQPFILMNVDMSGQFTMHIWVSFISGVIAAFPYVIWEYGFL